MSLELTDRQRAILRAIHDYACSHDGRSPGLRDLVRLCKLSSTSVAAYNLERLAGLGYVTLGNAMESRSARLTAQGRAALGLPQSRPEDDQALLEEVYALVEGWRAPVVEKLKARLGR